ncbi:MAG: 1-deoxy-D-xylulose-5-phosphate synthase, partial [Clostridia bacterium]|nr:1-deoxy-D-xylulose-5-phosphate synthase [Clostridia bacterium]
MSILSRLDSTAELKLLKNDELKTLAEEIRQVLLDTVMKNGGHLASNLGVVELTIALHSVFSSPEDRIIWDVGHQSYVHKLLTGRYGEFGTLRTYG